MDKYIYTSCKKRIDDCDSTSPTPSAERTGRKAANIARGAHIAYCTEGKTQVFQTIGHEIVPKDEKMAERASCFFSAKRQKKKMRVFFSSGLAFIFPPRRENSGKNRSGRENK